MSTIDLGKPASLHRTLDVAMPDGTMPRAEMRITGPQIMVYAAMTSAIIMFAKRTGVAPKDVCYSQVWLDDKEAKPQG